MKANEYMMYGKLRDMPVNSEQMLNTHRVARVGDELWLVNGDGPFDHEKSLIIVMSDRRIAFQGRVGFPWLGLVVAPTIVIVSLVAVSFEGLTSRRPPNKIAIALKFKKELTTLGGWDDIQWSWSEDGDMSNTMIYAIHPVGPKTYRFRVLFFADLSFSVNVNDKPGVRFNFKHEEQTDKTLDGVPDKDKAKVEGLILELAEAVRQSLK
jgi:hypothetical protein